MVLSGTAALGGCHRFLHSRRVVSSPALTALWCCGVGCRIIAALPEGSNFEPLMTLYLTDTTSPEDIAAAKASGVVKACKMYPAGATTNSESGVTDLAKLVPTFKAMEVRSLRERGHPAPSVVPHCPPAPPFSACVRAGIRPRAMHPRRGGGPGSGLL